MLVPVALHKAATVVAVSLVASLLVVAAPAGVGAEVRASESTRLGSDAAPVRGRDVVTLAVNPANANHIVALDEDFINRRCAFRTSFDGGATWAGGILEAPAEFEQPACGRFDNGDYAHVDVGGIAFGTGQSVYATFSWNRPGEGDSVLVAKSTDGGRTFGTAVVAISGGPVPNPTSDGYIRPKIGVQPRPVTETVLGDRVYVSSWRLTTDATSERRIVTATSSDGGATFGPPVDAQGPDQAREQSRPVIGPGGVAYLAWRTTLAGSPAPPMPAGGLRHVLGRSTDGGASWTRFNIGFAPGTRSTDPRLAVDPRTGTLYVAYWAPSGVGQPITPSPTVPAASSTDIFFQRSVDGGVTWSGPLRLNDDTVANGIIQRLPEISVAPNGRVDIVFEDRRNAYPENPLISAGIAHSASRGMEDYYYTSSHDFGVSFSRNRRISDRSINLNVGLDAEVTGSFYPPTIASRGTDAVMAAWGDSREGNYNTETHDVYQTTVNLSAAGSIPARTLPAGDSPSVSVAQSRSAYPGGLEMQGATTQTPVTQAVIVNEADSAAALAGSVLARDAWGPVLASPAAGLPENVKAEVSRLRAVGAFVIGNEAALSAAVMNDLANAGVPADKVQRLAGSTPAGTAREIAAFLDTRSASDKTAGRPAFPAAVVVNPSSAEAASASGLAASLRLPVLFVERDSIPPATNEALASLNIDKTLVIGGTGAVSGAVMAALPSPTRLGGDDVYATSRAVARESIARGLPSNIVYVADGASPMDAAALGSAVARLGGLMLLAPDSSAAAAQASIEDLGIRSLVDRMVIQSAVARPTPPPGGGTVPPLGGGGTPATAASGYRMVAGDGGVFTFGDRNFHGSTGDIRLNKPVVGGATDVSDYDGYWMVASDGGVFAFSAEFHGSLGGQTLSAPAVEIEPTPSGKGYYIVLADGKVHAFGDAKHAGDFSGRALNKPIIGMSVTTTGQGYWLVAEDGGIFNFGDAPFLGSMGATPLNAPVIDLAPQVDNQGYYLVARDGGVFTFGSAEFKGSTGAMKLNAPVIAMLVAPNGAGYWLAATDGGIFTFGGLAFLGSMGGVKLNSPVLDLIN